MNWKTYEKEMDYRNMFTLVFRVPNIYEFMELQMVKVKWYLINKQIANISSYKKKLQTFLWIKQASSIMLAD